jgi:inhibitor of cysteine peptidase
LGYLLPHIFDIKEGYMKNFIFFVLLFASSTSACFAEESKNPKVIKAQVGYNITIILKSNPTTGYQWQVAKPLDESTIKLISSEYLADKTNLVGAGGKQVWRFKTLKPSQTSISFKYVRPWEKNTPPQNEESYLVVIKQ